VTRALRIAGAVLLVVGGYVAFTQWSVMSLVDRTCGADWSASPMCRAYLHRWYASMLLPLSGGVLLAASFVRRKRETSA